MSGHRLDFRAVATAALLLVVSAPPGRVAAQSHRPHLRVTGVVGDAESGAPIPQALVALPELGIETLTDREGRFLLRGVPPGEHRWLFQALGYADWSEELALDDGENLRVGLLPQPLVLQTIVATANRLAERRRATGLGVRAVSRDEIMASVASNAGQLVADRSPHPVTSCAARPSSTAPAGGQQHPARVTPRRIHRPPGGADPAVGLCFRWRGMVISPQIYLDEELLPVPVDMLYAYAPDEIHTIEYYQHPAAGTMIRVYTVHFMKSGRALLPPGMLFR